MYLVTEDDQLMPCCNEDRHRGYPPTISYHDIAFIFRIEAWDPTRAITTQLS
jgi:hypothetical protein